jgi:catechol 2,3-dioxygenase-like lactoylglutathione lyase family enzyme
MLGDNAAIATVAVTDTDRAKAFYQGVLGLEVIDHQPAVTTYRSGGGKLFVYQSQFAGGNGATATTWVLDDIAAVVRDLAAKGVTFEHYDNLPGLTVQGDLHVTADATMTAAWFKDPDGNILALVSG